MKHVIIFAKLEYINIRDNVSKLLISLTNSKNNDKNFSYNLEKNDFISFSAFLLLVLFVYFIFQQSLMPFSLLIFH